MFDNTIEDVEPYHNPNEGRIIFNENFKRVKNRFEEPYVEFAFSEGTYSNYDFGDYSNILITISSGKALYFTGFQPKYNGQVIILTNKSDYELKLSNNPLSDYPISMPKEDVVSVALNDSVILKYDHINTVWRVISKS